MERNNLKLICRAHQLVNEGKIGQPDQIYISNALLDQQVIISGYKYMFEEQLVTVWSAPNYCYRCGNVASILEITDTDTRTPKIFEAVPDSQRVVPPRVTTPYFL